MVAESFPIKKDEEEHLHYHGVDKVEKHISVDEALAKLLASIAPVKSEILASSIAHNRVLFEEVKSNVDVPSRARSTRDGYAVRVADTTDVLRYKVTGDIRIGRSPKLKLGDGEAARVATGSYLPLGADAVVMIEYVKESKGMIELEREPRIGDNILPKGADLKRDSVVLQRGTRLRPQHVALLAQVKRDKVRVFRKPAVTVFSTGDELFDPFKRKGDPIQISDINRPFLCSMIEELNAKPVDLGIAKDNFEEIKKRIERGLKSSDALILSAGSSVGERDYALKAAESMEGMKILLHGVAMRPSSPTGLATYKGKPFILLPGFPTSAFMSFFVFARAAILKLSGEEISGRLEPLVKARMLDSYEGKSGIKHYLRVRVSIGECEEYVATVVKPTEAYYSSWLGKANGIAILDEIHTQLHEGDEARVFLIGKVESSHS